MTATHCDQPTTAPCREACPAGIDVPRYLRSLREGRFAEALAVIRERIPFAWVCGHACVHPCEAVCARSQFDEAVAIRMLKRVAAERGGGPPAASVRLSPTGKRVAVIGSGPCGLTAAHCLNLLGHRVVVHEALPQAGGMPRHAIPSYRLPAEAIEREIAAIAEDGVQIRTASRVDDAASLLAEGYDAVLVATGAWRPVRIGIPGEDSARVVDGLTFLLRVNGGERPDVGRRVVVVGGGNTAVDAARTAVRLGAETLLLYRRTIAEMPAGHDEVADAIEEGVRVEWLAAPVRIDGDQATCIRMALGDPGDDGRSQPVPLPGSEWRIGFDTLIVAIGQQADAGALGLAADRRGAVCADPGTLATPGRGVFAAGDAVKGPSSIIEAIAHGRQACVSIDRFLGGAGIVPEALSATIAGPPPEPAARGTARAGRSKIARGRRRGSFDTIERACSKAAAAAEAARCLSCDLRAFDVAVDGAVCKDCGYCREVCVYGIFAQSDAYNPGGYRPAVAVDTERCVGCLRCLYICPDFAITIRERTP